MQIESREPARRRHRTSKPFSVTLIHVRSSFLKCTSRGGARAQASSIIGWSESMKSVLEVWSELTGLFLSWSAEWIFIW